MARFGPEAAACITPDDDQKANPAKLPEIAAVRIAGCQTKMPALA